MTAFNIIADGPLETARLRLHHIHTRPHGPAHGQVLLLGGSNFDLRLKRDFLNSPLCAHFEVATYEPRGIGRTEHPPKPWRMVDYAQDALACVDALGWARADIVGESFGGMTALHVALIGAERVGRMALASTTAGGACESSYDVSVFLGQPQPAAAEAAIILQDSALAQTRSEEPGAFHAALSARLAFETAFADPSIQTSGYSALLAARRDHDVSDQLSDIVTPTLVCAGSRDRQAPPDAQKQMAASLGAARFGLFDAGHGVLFKDRSAMKAVLAHLTGDLGDDGRYALTRGGSRVRRSDGPRRPITPRPGL